MKPTTTEPADTPESLCDELRDLKIENSEIAEELVEINARMKRGGEAVDLAPRRRELIARKQEVEMDMVEINADLAAMQRKAEFREYRVAAVRQLTCALIVRGHTLSASVTMAVEMEAMIQKELP